jgi:hypothetical protein
MLDRARDRRGAPGCARARLGGSCALLVDEWGFTLGDAFIRLSVACDAGIAQGCKPAPGFGTIARFSMPKLDATPQRFRP